MENTTDNKKKIIFLGSMITAIVVLVVILLVMVIGGSKNIYVKYFDEATKLIDKAFDEASAVTDKDASKIGLSGKASIELDLNDELLDEETKKLHDVANGLEFNYEIKMDQEEKFIGILLSALKDSEELINAELVAIDDTGYVKVKDILDKYYEVELDEAVEFETDTEQLEIIDDIEIIYEIGKKEIRKQLNSDIITKENDEIRINGEKVKVKKHTLTITEEVAYETALAILDKIVNKEEALQAMTNIMNMESYYEMEIEEVEEELTSTMDMLKEELDALKEKDEDDEDEYDYYSSEFVINVYTKGKNIVKAEMGSVYDDEFEAEITLKITEKEDKKVEYVLIDSYDDEVLKVTVQDNGKDSYNVEMEMPEEDIVLTFAGVITDEKIDGTYEVKVTDYYSDETEEVKGNIFIESKKNSATIKFSVEADELGKVGINLEMNEIDKFDIPDVSDSTTTIDEDEVMEKAMNKLESVSNKLGIDLEELMGTSVQEPSYDWEEDYYYEDSYDWDTDTNLDTEFNFDELDTAPSDEIYNY
ncbi:MAG: hypothetical protein E7311_02605 [Clostridiales bacterium]|nr:hypothetical protein [Clostridiales bacterium]